MLKPFPAPIRDRSGEKAVSQSQRPGGWDARSKSLFGTKYSESSIWRVEMLFFVILSIILGTALAAVIRIVLDD